MTEEKQIILNMLKEGKITVEEASDLLGAIGDKKSRENDFTGRLTSTVDSILKKATEAISAIDLDQALDINNFNLKGEINSHKDVRVDDEIDEIKVDLVNGEILVEKSTDPGIIITSDVFSKKANLEDYINIEIRDNVLNIEENDAYKNIDASAKLKIQLGEDYYDKLNIDTVNARVEIADTDFGGLNIDSVNGKIIIINTKAAIDIDNVNGKIDIKNIDGPLSIDNVSGAIYLAGIKGDMVEVDNISGNIRVDGLESGTIKANSRSGSIRMYNIKETTDIDLETVSGTIVVDTTDYEGEIKAFVESNAINVTDKFINKIKTDEGYDLSTSADEENLTIKAKTGYGKVSLR
ncbi:DUF4097 family beta strand repeat-containing protein [uncultured Anaerococcus sp.]|uniref:DUF4097 family beta strand repeat-containing protein n=1 Tax=uncultured Anaerococcus sp. TaxID=293428 RepID=UPI0025EF681C|nr:DUF4097 family beta strand repeat-containing protein [uncultured Anaerococcus sp.]